MFMLVGLLVIQSRHSGDFTSMVLETHFICETSVCFHFIDSLRAVQTTSHIGYNWSCHLKVLVSLVRIADPIKERRQGGLVTTCLWKSWSDRNTEWNAPWGRGGC